MNIEERELLRKQDMLIEIQDSLIKKQHGIIMRQDDDISQMKDLLIKAQSCIKGMEGKNGQDSSVL